MGLIRFDNPIVFINNALLDQLSLAVFSSPKGKATALLHKTEYDQIQEMVFALKAESFVGRHATNKESETINILRGSLAMVFFSESGLIDSVIRLSSPPDGKVSGVRIPRGQWVAYLTGGEVSIIHEVACGPFKSANTRVWELSDVEKAEVISRCRKALET